MANLGDLESLSRAFPEDSKAPMLALVRAFATSLRFGVAGSAAVSAENFGGALVPIVTSSVSNNEVAVAHSLGRIPRLMIPLLPLGTVNATLPILTVTKAADAKFFYVKSATVSASCWAYVELLFLAAVLSMGSQL